MKTDSCNGFWLGVDLSEEWIDVSIARIGTPPTDWKTLPLGQFQHAQPGLREMVAWANGRLGTEGCIQGVCVESTGRLSYRFWEMLQSVAPHWPVASIINPKRSVDFGRSLGLRDKTDRIDAAILALYGTTYQPQGASTRAQTYRRLRELCRLREAYQKQRFALENNLRDNDDSFACRSLQRSLDRLRGEIKRLEDEAKRLIHEDPAVRRDIRRLQSIKGIGFITAWVLVAELGDLRHYSRTQIVSYVGLYPRTFRSGKSVVRKPRLVKGGGALVRKVLYNCARSILNSKNNTLKTYADRLHENGKCPMECLTALMRKLLLVARAVLIGEENYDPTHA